MALDIVEVKDKKRLAQFIRFPYSIYTRDSLYVPQLEHELKKQLSPDKNPFFRHAKVKFLLVLRDGAPAGRAASIVNDLHNEFHGEKTGFFGFFESANDKDVANLLLGAVVEDLREKGMAVMRGPMSFSTNEECGLLVEGFEHHPMLMTPYNPPYYAELIEGFGMRKVKDLYAYIYDIAERLPEKMLRVASIAEKKNIIVRPIRKDRFDEEMQAFKEVFNSAWEKNWGFVPLTDEELAFKGTLLKSVIVPDMTLIAEMDGETVGFVGLFPDMNYVLKRMNGKLNPWTIMKALYHSRKIKDLRLILMGIKAESRTRGVDALLYRDVFDASRRHGYKRMEFSWVLEDNEAMIRIIELMQGKLYKKFRIFEMPLI